MNNINTINSRNPDNSVNMSGAKNFLKSLGIGAYIWTILSLLMMITTLYKYFYYDPEAVQNKY